MSYRRPGIRARAGWTRLSRAGDKLTALWRHDASGWLVQHCGHPTANWPYYAVDPAHPERVVVAPSSRAFRSLADALPAVEDVVAGRRSLRWVKSDRYGLVGVMTGTRDEQEDCA